MKTEPIESLIKTFDRCAGDTKIYLIIILLIFGIFLILSFRGLLSIIKAGFNLESLLKHITKIAGIIKDYELKTTAGLINFTISIVMVLLTISVFLSSSVASVFGFSEDVTANRILLVLFTGIISLLSIWALYKFQKQVDLINRK